MSNTTKIEGLGDLVRRLRKAPSHIRTQFVAEVIVPTGYGVEASAKRNAPVQTGALRGDIHFEVTGDMEGEVRSGDAIGYAVPVHEGTATRAGNPYLRTAAQAEESKMEARVQAFARKLPEEAARL